MAKKRGKVKMKLDRKSLAVHHVAGEKGRYAINGVLLETDGTTVATDGKMLLVIQPSKQDEGKELVAPKEHFVIPLGFARDVHKAIPKVHQSSGGKFDYATITEAKQDKLSLRIQNVGVQLMETKPESGDYPKWKDLIPSIQKETMRFCLGLEVLERLVKVLKEVLPKNNGRTTSSVEFLVEGPKKAIGIRAQAGDGGRRMIGVLMPVTHPGGPDELTDWEKAHGLKEFREKQKGKGQKRKKPASRKKAKTSKKS